MLPEGEDFARSSSPRTNTMTSFGAEMERRFYRNLWLTPESDDWRTARCGAHSRQSIGHRDAALQPGGDCPPLKYSPVDRPVEVRLILEGPLARVSVRDEGPGLSLVAQELLWQRFSRVPGIAVQDSRGNFGANLGVGLYLCREIIERHHGCVGVESVPGQGSTFWFTIALATSSENNAPRPPL